MNWADRAGRRCVAPSLHHGARRERTERWAVVGKRGRRSASAWHGHTGVSDSIRRSGGAYGCLTRVSGVVCGPLTFDGGAQDAGRVLKGCAVSWFQDQRLPVVSGFQITGRRRARLGSRPAEQREACVRTAGHTGPGMRQSGTTARRYGALGRGLACGDGAAVPLDAERCAAYRGERGAALRVSEGGARCRYRRLRR